MPNQIPVPEFKYYAVRGHAGDVYFSVSGDAAAGRVSIPYDELPELIRQQMSTLDMAANAAGSADVDGVGSRISAGFRDRPTTVYWMYEIPSLDYTGVYDYLQTRKNTRETEPIT